MSASQRKIIKLSDLLAAEQPNPHLNSRHYRALNSEIIREKKPIFCYGDGIIDEIRKLDEFEKPGETLEGGGTLMEAEEQGRKRWRYMYHLITQNPTNYNKRTHWQRTLDEYKKQNSKFKQQE